MKKKRTKCKNLKALEKVQKELKEVSINDLKKLSLR
jgi:hypothetical protein